MFNMYWITRKQSGNSCVWTFAVGFKRETFSKNWIGAELHSTCKGSSMFEKKCFPQLIKVEKMMSSLKTLQDELREVSQKKTVCIKWGLSEDVSVALLFEAARDHFKSPMQLTIKQNFVFFKCKRKSHKVFSSRSNYWISNSQAFCSSCDAARIS